MISYQNILNSEFIRRHAKNPAYSLRGYARDLGLSQSFLSQVLNKKRNLSDERAIYISNKLNLKGSTKKLFINLVRINQTAHPESRRILQSEIDRLSKARVNFKVLAEDVFNVVADWHYFAILELTALENFKNDTAWISRKLRVPVADVKIALETLMRMGLMTETQGRLAKTDKDYIFENIPSAAIRKHHRDTLKLADQALTEQEMSAREFFTVVFAMDPAQIKTAKTRIREFCDELMAEMQDTKPRSLYKLAVQFFRLDKEQI